MERKKEGQELPGRGAPRNPIVVSRLSRFASEKYCIYNDNQYQVLYSSAIRTKKYDRESRRISDLDDQTTDGAAASRRAFNLALPPGSFGEWNFHSGVLGKTI